MLSIANKVGARILSNDSFQEFHGEYPWLFDEGRLIGGKPVPYVGWVFVERLPVKGRGQPQGGEGRRGRRRGADAQGGARLRPAARRSQPMPVPTAPPPGCHAAAADGASHAASGAGAPPSRRLATIAAAASEPATRRVNDLLPFLDFVEHHPVGSSVNGVVESYSSHGAYVRVGDLRGYVPLRLMGDPPPRSAR